MRAGVRAGAARADAADAAAPDAPAPRRVATEARARLLAGEPPEAVSATWPAFGRVVESAEPLRGSGFGGGAGAVAGATALREVTFVAELPAAHEGMIHLNGITDGHREDLAPALLERVPGTILGVIAYLLPDDLVASYRFAVAPELPRDAGLTREGWTRIHRLGRPDPRNPRELPNPLGTRSSVLMMPGGRVHPAWVEGGSDAPPRRAVRAEAVPVEVGSSLTVLRVEGTASDRALILFDGETWAGLGIRDALARLDAPPAVVVLVPSGDLARRAALLPHPDRLLPHVESTVLPALGAGSGAPFAPEQVVVAGQSYGGLAAASVVALRPDLAATAIVQSGSFHFRADDTARPPAGQVGDLVHGLVGASVRGRFAVQLGTNEPGMRAAAEAFAAAAAAGGAEVDLRPYSGGHDYAWWRTGLFDALDALG